MLYGVDNQYVRGIYLKSNGPPGLFFKSFVCELLANSCKSLTRSSPVAFEALAKEAAKAGSRTSFKHIKMLNNLITYLKEVRLELGKVNWPSREQTIRYTILVIAVSLGVAIFLGGLDYIFSLLLDKFVL